MRDWLRYYRDGLSVPDYIEHVTEMCPKKGKLYSKYYQSFLDGAKCNTVLEVFPKSGEFYDKHKSETHESRSNRPRCICNPDMHTKVIGGFINFVLMKAFKKAQKHYIAFKPLGGKEKALAKGFR